jgi:acylphosphatase
MSRIAATLRVEGRVQGVGFRWWTVGVAQRLGLSGWARNRADGSVEILAIGEAAAIADLERAVTEGPQAAHVTAVRRTAAEDDGSQGFHQRKSV